MVEDPVFWRRASKTTSFTRQASYADHRPVAFDGARDSTAESPAVRFCVLSFFTPTVLPMIAVANIWLFFYSPGYGLLDQALGLFGFSSTNWLGNQHTALACLIAVAVWKDRASS